ncbi:cellulase family glycosylhydrolase [Mucilaginibacter pocheonensis]|uniref:Aryl-phospho-beta-D-glucosidase BglC (GH1 family) n=1 Tax=Mucilaginibacter pocheonensis TaxID=398050 RepID=A0ABU1TIW0_9SPHI|nr:cellulase family glycosylhydrolase [Mucilaginibacter pocheonensis]MDR6944731.1 aryl-phospho-beta-D-glucosidase BglC (GH1 family) [Mucilaginibacter pocheonensis]
MKTVNFLSILFSIVVVSFFSCKKANNPAAELTINQTSIVFTPEGGTQDLSLASNATWNISNAGSSWLQLSTTSGNSGSAVVHLTTLSQNSTGSTRSSILVISSSNGELRKVTVSQTSAIYPSYNTSPKAPDASGMSSNAVQIAAKIKLGWNIGNTLEAQGGETGWGNPLITEDYIKFVKQQGFNAIRLPCAWNMGHLSNQSTAQIDPNWLNRVKEVVGYCVKNDMYVLLNIHWDGGWLDNNINAIKQDSINAKQKALWEQIATTMRDFDEHLMFASANEPPVDNAAQMAILASYHQTFVNAVRSTGGKNSYRVLVVQGPSTNMDKTSELMTSLPQDQAAARMMVEVHYYDPFQFTSLDGDATWGKMFYYWGTGHHSTIEPDRNATWGEESGVDASFVKMKKFADKGIPVLLGEYGAYRRNNTAHVPLDLPTHEASVDYWLTYITKKAIANGMLPFYWDTGGALDRRNYTVKDQRTIVAIKAGAN